MVAKKTPTKKTGSATKTKKAKAAPKLPAIPGNAVLKRLALAAADSDDVQISREVYSHILALYLATLKEQGKMALAALKAYQSTLSESKMTYNLSHALLKDLPVPLSKKKADSIQTCLQASKGKKSMVLHECLLGPRSAFKKYLTVGSIDGTIKPIFTGAHPYRFGKDAINALQYSVEQSVAGAIADAWSRLGKNKKKLMHKHFVEAGIDLGDAPAAGSPKKKTPKKKAGSAAKPKKGGAAKGSKGKKTAEKIVEEIEVILEDAPKPPRKPAAKKGGSSSAGGAKAKGKGPAKAGGKAGKRKGKRGGKGKKKVQE